MSGYLPQLNEIASSTEMISQFAGYNHNLRNNEAEFDDMKNMSSSYYPVLSPRGKRGIFTHLAKPNGLIAKNNLFWVDGTTLYYNGVAVSGLVLADSVKQFVSMGAYLLIWPDKVYFNTADSTHGNLEALITIDGSISCTLTKLDGAAYDTPTIADTAPDDPQDGDMWLNTSETIHTLQQYSASSATWVQIATTYIKIAAEDIGSLFSEYDGVTISGFTDTGLNGDKVLYGAGDDYIIIAGILDTVVSQVGGVTVKRSVPDVEFLTESQNRVWGCSSSKHQIYACKLGDPKNWNCFMGLSTDSYAATIGSDGDFTGACTHLGYVLFFKENKLHKVYGTMPSNYTTTNVECRGVEKGSEKSLVILNEILYYKAPNAICSYDGSLPTSISTALGDVRYIDAVAGAIGNKYYISMKDSSGHYHLFVFDSQYGMWHKEDNANASYFAAHENELFYIDADTKNIMTVGGRLSVHEGGIQYNEDGALEDEIEWYAETGEIGLDLPDNKYISKFLIRLEVPEQKIITVAFKYDSGSDWDEHEITIASALRTVKLPIIPRRCDHMRMKISGTDECKIYSITKTIEEGGN